MIEYRDFEKVDIRVGTILAAEPLEGARKPAFKLRIDFGPDVGIKHSSAQITKRHRAEELAGTQILAVVNLEPKRIARFLSEVLVLGVSDADGNVVLVRPQFDAPNGSRLY